MRVTRIRLQTTYVGLQDPAGQLIGRVPDGALIVPEFAGALGSWHCATPVMGSEPWNLSADEA